VIVMLDVGRFGQRVNHFAVVAGYSADAMVVDSGGRRQAIPLPRFARMWAATKHCTLTIEPPS
jgi:hypothetical protein